MKKLWYVVIVVAIIYLGWEFFRPRAGVMQSQTSTASVIDAMGGGVAAPAASAGDVSMPAAVTYSATGFAPASITVKKGTAVMWTNLSGDGMRIIESGNPPAFDQSVASLAGSQWSFTFNKAGTWKYRNDANKSFSGTVIVTE